ncbi:MAG: hypothetical protein MZV65_31895 [Chromatiales bacterium]|nr:hypothetical protein [Chromatiales bacterium]
MNYFTPDSDVNALLNDLDDAANPGRRAKSADLLNDWLAQERADDLLTHEQRRRIEDALRRHGRLISG